MFLILLVKTQNETTNEVHAEKYSKTYVKRPLSKIPQSGFQYQLLLYARQKYYRMLQGDSTLLLTFIKLSFLTKISVLSILEWPFYTKFTVIENVFRNYFIMLKYKDIMV